ncbi:unnamed protein product [Diplocarpon coronariae]
MWCTQSKISSVFFGDNSSGFDRHGLKPTFTCGTVVWVPNLPGDPERVPPSMLQRTPRRKRSPASDSSDPHRSSAETETSLSSDGKACIVLREMQATKLPSSRGSWRCRREGISAWMRTGSTLSALGPVGLGLVYQALELIIAISGLSVGLEIVSYFPNRSDAEAMYLEQGWPRLKYYSPTAPAAFGTILSFSGTCLERILRIYYRKWNLRSILPDVKIPNGWFLRSRTPFEAPKYKLHAVSPDCPHQIKLVQHSFTVIGLVSSSPDPGSNSRTSLNGTARDAYGDWSTSHTEMYIHSSVLDDEIIKGKTIAACLFSAQVFGGSAARALNIRIRASRSPVGD